MRRRSKEKVYLIPPEPEARSKTHKPATQTLTPLGRSINNQTAQINAEVVVPTTKAKRKGTVIVSDSEGEEEETLEPQSKFSKTSRELPNLEAVELESSDYWPEEELQIEDGGGESDPIQLQVELKQLVAEMKKEIRKLDSMSQNLENKVNIICNHLKKGTNSPAIALTSAALNSSSTQKEVQNAVTSTSKNNCKLGNSALPSETPQKNVKRSTSSSKLSLEETDSGAIHSGREDKSSLINTSITNISDLQFIEVDEIQLESNSFEAPMRSTAFGRASDYKHREVSCIAVCSENGEVKLWNTATREMVTHIPQNVLQEKPQDLCFVSSSILAVGYEEFDLGRSYLSFIHFVSVEKKKILIRVQHFDAEDNLKGVSTIASVAKNQLEFTFGSGGRDGVVRLWRFESPQDYAEDARLRSLTIAHHDHVGSVNSLYYSPGRGVLLSGADDGKLIAYSMNGVSVVSEFQYSGKVIDVTANPRNGNLFLACLETKSNQLNICDYRTKQPSAQRFGFAKHQLLPKAVKPSFDSTGNLVVCGDKDGTMHIWDLRYLAKGAQTVPVHDSVILSTLFHPEQDTIFSTSADDTLGFTNYTYIP
ncbi:hypothetical protein K7432_004810 [Basidiobolus ranarum]|uniref:Uncharacterized protein n=1 Tax=Basidiobolus ranarum TaxID=34480 RepID=A0ABR2WXH9_9FUNG